MGKETQLLEAAAAGNNSKVEQLLRGRSRLKRFLSKEKLLAGISEGSEASPSSGLHPILTKKQSTSLDVDCVDDDGSSPLILASLNGHKDVVSTLIEYSANVHWMDRKGNTALHFASWKNRSEIVEILLINGAKVNQANLTGNTSLHYACEHCPPGKGFTIIKLLQHDCDVMRTNKSGDTAFDLAVRFNRRDAVSLLVDADPATLKHTKAIIEASKNGRREIVEILLEAGMDPNCFDGTSGSCPLHEAVRFFRKGVAQLLLEFGADPRQSSANSESAYQIVMQHPDSRREEFLRVFRDFEGKTARIPRSVLEMTTRASEQLQIDSFITYPLLRNKPYWTQANGEYCSAWTSKHPHTCLLDNDPTSYWRIPAAGAYSWVAFDLGANFTLTGIRISGWDNGQMVYNFMLETGPSLKGPWTQVGKYRADSIGSESMDDDAEPQDFRGFYATARYWRLVVADNYGDHTTSLAEVQFFGVEDGVVELFERLDIKTHLKSFVLRGYNQLSDLALMTEKDVNAIRDHGVKQQLLTASRALREKYHPPINLQWAIPPPYKVVCDKIMTEFAVFSESFTVGDLEVVAKGAVISGPTRRPLISKDNGYLSKATFSGLIFKTAGTFPVEVRSVLDHSVCLRAEKPIVVPPPPMRESKIGQMFADIDDILQFDI